MLSLLHETDLVDPASEVGLRLVAGGHVQPINDSFLDIHLIETLLEDRKSLIAFSLLHEERLILHVFSKDLGLLQACL